MRKWLVISYFSDIEALSPSRHTDDRLPWLWQFGVEPIILSSMCSPKQSDFTKIRVPSLAPSGIRYEMRYVTRRAFSNKMLGRLVQFPFLLGILPAFAIESLLLNFDCTWSWFVAAARAAVKAARDHDVELIYSTGGPASAHVAALACAKQTGLPWIAEFQDPIVGPWITRRKIEQNYYARLEKQVVENADASVYMTSIAMEEARKRLGEDASKTHYIRPGCDEGIFTGVRSKDKQSDKFVIGHFGSLKGNRNLGGILNGIKHIVDKSASAKYDFRVMIMGDMDFAQAKMLNEFPYQEMLLRLGMHPRRVSLQKMLECNYLLLIQNASSGAAVSIPAKAYEYLHSGVPVFALTYDNPELQEMMNELGHAAVDLQDQDSLSIELERLYLNWCNKEPQHILPSPYTISQAVRDLIDLADNTCLKFSKKAPLKL